MTANPNAEAAWQVIACPWVWLPAVNGSDAGASSATTTEVGQ